MPHGENRGYDYVIVGSGSAGSLLANRLSQDPQTRVLVLEAGGQDRNHWLKLPVGYFRTIYDARFSRVFDTEPSEGSGNRAIAWPRGRIVGGSSSINGLIFIRGQADDFDGWAQSGAIGWSYADVLPHFRALERYSGGSDSYRGRTGELQVSDLRNANPACAAWVEAAQQYGLPYNPDFNGETTYGVGSYQLTLGRRFRASAAASFLRPALKRGNVDLLTGALVSRVIIEAGKAVGVEYLAGKERHVVRADREVILSAGTIQSPQILQLSGIGPADHLRSLGLPVLVDAPEVGENLQDHYQMRLIVRLNRKLSLNDDVRNVFKLARMGAQWVLQGTGPLTVGAGQVGGAACTPYAHGGRPDVQFNVMPLSVDKPGTPLHRYSGFTASVYQCHPESRGRVSVTSADPAASPRIEPRYFERRIDRQTIVAGVKMLRDIHEQPAFKALWSEEVVPGSAVRSDEQIWDAVRSMGGTVFHPVGTCRMGTDSASVLDPQLRVRGVDGLRVIDASVMPRIVSANSNAATLMVAEKGASLVLGRDGAG
ncbi:GMC family oxidoreductase N-terminal domain-containing protein [Devosia sp. PTR5]|uniref:GMC family oxidoreductase N-terminal domain-containing protein n=1 Tax=Devosia oryzisoli TaxID=2774138 RepID=A0A927FUY7_9HYPH|nr:GMC family oxidoreductase N-terminal domain-containing protein [Devosia oryzisoli]MBD8065977.1 GMC family oxidoreductase N-terminal domain-containing protein [Devosia oryzisoli]